jgi:hypothetical protein
MGVDDQQRPRISPRKLQGAQQSRVLEQVREVAGVKGVAVVQGGTRWNADAGLSGLERSPEPAPPIGRRRSAARNRRFRPPFSRHADRDTRAFLAAEPAPSLAVAKPEAR